MLFNSYIFIFLFLPLALLGYYGLNYVKQYKLALAFLTGMSMWFCGYMNPNYLLILLISIGINFILVEVMSSTKRKIGRKTLLFMGLLWNIGALLYFKYYNFFVENINAVFKTDLVFVEVILPLGISFYTFQQLSYIIDYYRGESEKYDFLEYTAYVTFFPKLIQGPITYHHELIPQFREEENRKPNFDNLSKGIYAFALGLAKKVLIADTLSKVVNIGYSNINELNVTSTLLVMICYSLQIYFDFSGYCDMASGIGYFFHMELPINFNSPYKAQSIIDFWSRWHMTLTRFFTKYVYIPLGGNRKGKVRTYINVMIVFLISGFWHGANWSFLLWGAMHGVLNVIERWKLVKKVLAKIPKAIRVAGTFAFATFAWSLFRADSVEQAKRLWNRLFVSDWGAIYTPMAEVFNDMTEIKLLYRLGFSGVITSYPGMFLVLFVVVILFACFFMKNTQEKVKEMRFTNGRILIVVLLMVWSILSLTEVSEFLYVNF